MKLGENEEIAFYRVKAVNVGAEVVYEATTEDDVILWLMRHYTYEFISVTCFIRCTVYSSVLTTPTSPILPFQPQSPLVRNVRRAVSYRYVNVYGDSGRR